MPNISLARRIWWADMGLVGIAVFWGSGFALSDLLIQTISPLWLLSARFLLSSALLLPLFWKRLLGEERRLLGAASLVGILLGLTYAVHIYGLVLSTPGKQAFIQSSSVALVPLLYGLWYGRWPSRVATLGALITTAGLFVLGFTPGMLFNAGDALSLLLAFLVALNVMAVGYLSRRMDPLALAVTQILACTVLLTAGALLSLWATSRLQRDLKRSWRVDVLGMWLAASGWAGYTAISLVTEPAAWVHWLISATMCAGAIARITHTGRQRRHTEAQVRAMQGDTR